MTSKPQGSILRKDHEQSVGSTSNESSAPVNSQISRYRSRPTDNELSDDRKTVKPEVRPSVAYNVKNYASRNAAGTVTKPEGFCLTNDPSNLEELEGERGKTELVVAPSKPLNASLNPRITSSNEKSDLALSKTNFYSADYHHQREDLFISQNDSESNSNIGSERLTVSMYKLCCYHQCSTVAG